MATKDIVFKIKADIGNAPAQIEKVAKAADDASESVTDLDKSFGALKVGLAGVLAGAGIASFIQQSAQLAIANETTAASFTVMLKSGEAAEKMLADLAAFGAATPFQLPELEQSARTLLSFGVAGDQILPTLKSIGDVAAGTQQPITELAAIFGKARAAGRVMTEDLNQLAERGIPVYDLFAKQFGITTDEVRKFAETGRISFANLEQAFTDVTSEGGLFFNMMEVQSQTTAGAISNMKDSAEGLMREIGSYLLPVIKAGAVALSSFFGAIKDNIGSIVTAGKVIVTATAGYLSYRTAVLASSAATAVMNFNITGLITRFRALSVAMMSNPFGLIAGAIGATVTALVLFKDELGIAIRQQSTLEKINKNVADSLKAERGEIDAKFEALKRTNPKSKERLDLINEINSTYGTTIQNLKDEKAFAEQVAKAYTQVVNALEKEIILKARQDALTPLIQQRQELQKQLELQQIIAKGEEDKQNKLQGGLQTQPTMTGSTTLTQLSQAQAALNAVNREIDLIMTTTGDRISKLGDTGIVGAVINGTGTGAADKTKKTVEETLTTLAMLQKAFDDLNAKVLGYINAGNIEALPREVYNAWVAAAEALDSYKENLDRLERNPVEVEILTPKTVGKIEQAKTDIKTLSKAVQDVSEETGLAWQDTYQQIADGVQGITSTIVSGTNQLLQGSISLQDQLIKKQQERVDEATALAQQGNVAQLEAERQRLDALQAQRAKFVKQQQDLALLELALNSALTISNSLVAASKAGAQGGIAAPLTIASTLAALGIGFAVARQQAQIAASGFKDGGFTGNGQSDDVAGVVHKNEFVHTAETTRKYRPIFEAIHRGRTPVEAVLGDAIGSGGGKQLLEAINKTNTLLSKQGASVTLDEQGFSIFASRVLEKRKRANSR
jgi:tape measure domain-containing protein